MSEEMTDEEAQELNSDNFKAMQRDKHYAEKRATALEDENNRLRERNILLRNSLRKCVLSKGVVNDEESKAITQEWERERARQRERAREKERRDDVLESYKGFAVESCGVCKFERGDYCKRFPPQVVGTGRSSVKASTEYPRVSLHDWCGEFKLSNKFVNEHVEEKNDE